MRILVACESSGTVREAFRKLGHDAWSCDLLPADDGSPYHHHEDCRPVITDDGPWDLVIAHPPCTHLASAGAKHFSAKRADGRQAKAIELFLDIINACRSVGTKWVVENPIGIMSTEYQKPTQIVHPWQFGHEASKSTCLWLHGVAPLTPTKIVGKGDFHTTKSGKRIPKWDNLPPSQDRWKIRSKTFQGIADAMAQQWGGDIRLPQSRGTTTSQLVAMHLEAEET